MSEEKPRILVVDDDTNVRFYTVRLMRSAGYTVREADCGAACLAVTREWRPALILLDVMLGREDGRSVCAELKRDPALASTLVVLMSGQQTSPEEQAKGLEGGGDGYIPRPVDSRELLARVRAYLRIQEAEQQRRCLEDRLHEKLRLEALGTLAGGVGHEINNPLTGIINYAELIKDRAGSDQVVAEYAGEIITESQRIATIVRSLLTFTQASGDLVATCSFADLVGTVLSLARPVLQDDGIELRVDVAADLPAVRCQACDIQDVLLKLLLNARDAVCQRYPAAAADKLITVAVKPHRDAQGEWARVTVEDRGNGISAEILPHLFEPFYTTKNRTESSGLALAMARRIVEAHGGRLTVESEVGRGTRFHMDLRVDVAQQSAADS